MNQLTLKTGFERGTKRTAKLTAKQVFLEEMLAVVLWSPWSLWAHRTRLPGSPAVPRTRS